MSDQPKRKWCLPFFHKWKIIAQDRLEQIAADDTVSLGLRFILQCEICGTVKKKDLI